MKSFMVLLSGLTLLVVAGCGGASDAICGDGTVSGLEQCDDGNTAGNDGCSATCAPEYCGNGSVELGEACDDGNFVDGDGCSSTCNSDETCGNGILELTEVCDDGNTTSGDGCDAACSSEERCGNGVMDQGEACDDGNLINGDGCTITCADEATCGDGNLDTGEQCDAFFGCSVYCTIEPCIDDLVVVGAPTNHVSTGGTYGNWVADPMETLGAGRIWVMQSYIGSTVVEYASLADMIAATPADTWVLTNGWDGTGAVVLDGYLYYNKTNTPNMIKYDLATHTEVLDVPLPNAGFRNTFAYQWGGYSDIDFAVDELGLWVIYATQASSGNIVISQLSEIDLSITDTWTTTRLKTNTGNSFMICGDLYTTASYSALSTTIDYKYETATSTESNPSIIFTNPGTYNSMIDYNRKERMLYSWDNARHQTYLLGF